MSPCPTPPKAGGTASNIPGTALGKEFDECRKRLQNAKLPKPQVAKVKEAPKSQSAFRYHRVGSNIEGCRPKWGHGAAPPQKRSVDSVEAAPQDSGVHLETLADCADLAKSAAKDVTACSGGALKAARRVSRVLSDPSLPTTSQYGYSRSLSEPAATFHEQEARRNQLQGQLMERTQAVRVKEESPPSDPELEKCYIDQLHSKHVSKAGCRGESKVNRQQEVKSCGAAILTPRACAKWYFLDDDDAWAEIGWGSGKADGSSLFERLEKAYAGAYDDGATSKLQWKSSKKAKCTYEYDVHAMTQTNLLSGTVRRIKREGSARAVLKTRAGQVGSTGTSGSDAREVILKPESQRSRPSCVTLPATLCLTSFCLLSSTWLFVLHLIGGWSLTHISNV